jgi:hypothetical protein
VVHVGPPRSPSPLHRYRNSYLSNDGTVKEARRVRWAGHVARMGGEAERV